MFSKMQSVTAGGSTTFAIPDGDGHYLHSVSIDPLMSSFNWDCQLVTTDEDMGVEAGSYDDPIEAIDVMTQTGSGVYMVELYVRNPNFTDRWDVTLYWP